jgi:alkylresorcinol/alkylpyrone synthase
MKAYVTLAGLRPETREWNGKCKRPGCGEQEQPALRGPRASPSGQLIALKIAAVGKALPPHFYDQGTLLEALQRRWSGKFFNPERLERLHRNVLVGGRHLALPIHEYDQLTTWGKANDAWIRVAQEVGGAAVLDALGRAGLTPADVDSLIFVTVTGVATPSIDARLMNRLGLPPRVKRMPIFGLGCVAGAAGLSRAADYVRAFPDQVAVLLSVELCSLTLQEEDLSIPNLIASGLFGDGAAAAVVVGDQRPAGGPRIVATRSVFYPDSERVMGWDISESGFRIVLSADVPEVARRFLGADVDAFLAEQGLTRADIASWVCHPGGPKVLEAMQESLELPEGALDVTWKSLREVGNLSSTSVLMVLRDTLDEHRPAPGSYGMLLAMGPGFCSELVLLQW